MKFFHLSDLHLGLRLKETSILEDQRFILEQITNAAKEHKPDAVVIAGDVFDKSVAPVEAIKLFEDFLGGLCELDIPVLVISGNHDSPERLSFGSEFFKKSGVYISPVYDGNVKKITLKDEFGEVDFYLLPFIRPNNVRRFYPDEKIYSYTDALKTAVDKMNVDTSRRNVIAAHQNLLGAAHCDSETVSIGGVDAVDFHVFEKFDYTALGHIHNAQDITKETIRYCGTPLKYSFSEIGHDKSITVVTMAGKGSVSVDEIPLVPLRDMREIRGKYDELMDRSFYQTQKTDDFLRAVLTDETDIPDAMGKLRIIYPNILTLCYDNSRTRSSGSFKEIEARENKSVGEIFEEFFESRNSRPLSDEQKKLVAEIFEGLEERAEGGEAE